MKTPASFSGFVITSAVLFAFVTIGFLAGRHGNTPMLESQAFGNPPASMWEAASGGKSMSFATGRIEDGIEALFGLDHLTGDLFCWILNPRTGELASTFRVNAAADLAVDGDADYVMASGLMDFRNTGDGNTRISHSVIYVGDGNGGKVVGYALRYDPQAIGRGSSNSGQLELICNMVTRAPGQVRNQGIRNEK